MQRFALVVVAAFGLVQYSLALPLVLVDFRRGRRNGLVDGVDELIDQDLAHKAAGAKVLASHHADSWIGEWPSDHHPSLAQPKLHDLFGGCPRHVESGAGGSDHIRPGVDQPASFVQGNEVRVQPAAVEVDPGTVVADFAHAGARACLEHDRRAVGEVDAARGPGGLAADDGGSTARDSERQPRAAAPVSQGEWHQEGGGETKNEGKEAKQPPWLAPGHGASQTVESLLFVWRQRADERGLGQ